MPALKYTVSEYTFNRTFLLVSLVIINYFTHINIFSCGLLLQLNDNSWVRVFFSPHEFYSSKIKNCKNHKKFILF